MYMPIEPLANSTDEINRRRHEDDFHWTINTKSDHQEIIMNNLRVVGP